jgi:hypothetical protein
MLNLDIVFSKIEILIFGCIEIKILISWMHRNFLDTSLESDVFVLLCFMFCLVAIRMAARATQIH